MTNAVAIAQGGSNNVTMRNRIINGAMVIDQRNAGASKTINTDPLYTLDRWCAGVATNVNNYTIQQSTTVPTSGFKNSLLVTMGTGVTVSSGGYAFLCQSIEGYNVADFNLGTASASAFTVSFWVRSSVTGTFGLSIRNGASTATYCTTYVISSTNTWEQKTVTIPAITSSTWYTDNSVGLTLFFDLGVGSTYSATANQLNTGANYFGVTGTTKLAATTGATFYITGVQLEKGTTATPFEQRLYGTEYALCQRYFQTATQNTAVAISSGAVLYPWHAMVSMRTRPSAAIGGAGVYSGTVVYYESAPWITAGSTTGAQALSSHTGIGGGDINITATYTSAPTAGQLVCLFNQYTPDTGGASNLSYLMLSAEL